MMNVVKAESSMLTWLAWLIWMRSYANCNHFEPLQTLDAINGLMAAFVDFNFDRLTDVVLVTDNGCSVQLALGYQSKPYLRMDANMRCSFGHNCEDRITGIIVSDFTGDATVDILLVTSRIGANQKIDFKLWALRANQLDASCNISAPLAQHITSFPSTLDHDGDMSTDFIVQTDQCPKELWTKLRPKCLTEMSTNQTMRYPNSNAFIDLSKPKDFRPDIVISGTNHFEYWFNHKGFPTSALKLIEYPNQTEYQYIGRSTFADIDFDGVIDHLIPVCKRFVDTCEGPQIVVLSQSGSTYEWQEVLDSDLASNYTFIETQVLDYLNFAIDLKIGDIDADGYPDIVTLMSDTNSIQKVVFLKNVESDKGFGRRFTLEWMSNDSIWEPTSNRSIYLVSLFDFEENGQLDILVASQDHTGNFYSSAYLNSGQTFNYFLKVHVSSGVCHSDCPQITSALIGPHMCFSLSEGKRIGCGGQLSQTSHFALQLPFVLFGLGDTPNFVENLTVAIPSGTMDARSQTWLEIVPDSRIVIIPYPANETEEWVQKLYLNPKFAFQTLVTLVCICCLLIVIIALLHKRDLRRDIIAHKEYKKHWL